MRAFNCLCTPSSNGAKYINHLFFHYNITKEILSEICFTTPHSLQSIQISIVIPINQSKKKKDIIFLYYFPLTLVLTLNTPFLFHSSSVCFCHTSQLVFKTLHILFYPLHEFRDHLCPFKTIQCPLVFACFLYSSVVKAHFRMPPTTLTASGKCGARFIMRPTQTSSFS